MGYCTPTQTAPADSSHARGTQHVLEVWSREKRVASGGLVVSGGLEASGGLVKSTGLLESGKWRVTGEWRVTNV